MPQENPVTGRPMSSLLEVFGGAKNTPSQVFQRSRAENAGTVANHRANDLAMACPTCEAQSKGEVRLFSKPDVGYYCINGHKWKDYDELMSMNPRKLEFRGTPARQDGWAKFTVEMPGSVLQDLQRKYGERLASTLRGMMDIMSQPKFIVMPEEDIKRLAEHTGTEPRTSGELVGAVYSLKQTNQELTERISLLQKNRGSMRAQSPTSVVVELGELAPEIFQKASDWNQEPGEIIADKIREAITNRWF